MISGPEFDAYTKLLDTFEGRFNFLYADTGGIPTTGCGHACFTAAEAVRIGFTDAEWQVIRYEAPRGRVASFYEMMTTSRLTDAQIDALKLADLTEAWNELLALWPACEAFPPAVQCVVLDMGYNLGDHKEFTEFIVPPHRFGPACNREDWVTAAVESHRNGIQDARNEWAAAQLRACAVDDNS